MSVWVWQYVLEKFSLTTRINASSCVAICRKMFQWSGSQNFGVILISGVTVIFFHLQIIRLVVKNSEATESTLEEISTCRT